MHDFGSSVIVGHGMSCPAIEARVTAPDEPSVSSSGAHQANLAAAYYQLGYGDIWGDARSETPDSALTFSAVWACVRVIAQTLASVCWHTYERGPAGRTRQEIEDDVSWLLGLQANPETTALEWRQVTLKDALTWGNGYSEIERTNGGRPVWLWRLDPDRVSPDRTSSGQLVYEVENGSGVKNTVLLPEQVYHLKGLGPDGLVGWSVVKMAATSIRLGKQTEKYGSDTFGRGIMPSGVLDMPGNVTDVQRKEYRRSFQEAHAGQRNQHGVIVLGGGAKFTPFTLPNDDMQFLSTRQFQVSDIARWYGVPPHKIGDLSRSTNNNIEEQGREFVTDCLGPWAARLETEANVKLYGRTTRGRRYTKLDLEPIQRGNSETQATTTAAKVNGGLWTPNEGRAYLGDNPIPGADVLLVQGAMTTLDRVVNPPEPPAPAAPPKTPEPPPAKDANGAPADNRAELRRVFGGLLAEAYGRLYRVNADKAKRAANKGKLAEHVAEWYAMPASTARVAEILRPIVEAACIAAGVPADLIGPRVESAALAHVAGCRDGLLNHGLSAAAGWSAEAAASAETVRLFDPDQDRDENGRFATEGGGGEQDKRDDEDTDREAARDEEDQAVGEARDAEDEKVSDAREKEDNDEQAQRDAEDKAHDDAEAALNKEEEGRSAAREQEDKQTQDQRDKEDRETQAEQDKIDDQRQKEDDERDAKREAQDKDVEDRYDRDEITDAQRIAEHADNDKARDREDAATDKARDKEDGAREKAESQRETQREKEDAATEKTRDREDKEHEKKQDAIEKSREKVKRERDRQDAAQQKDRDRQDKELEKARQKEDRDREAKRKEEDRQIAEKRKQEDKGAKALATVGAAR